MSSKLRNWDSKTLGMLVDAIRQQSKIENAKTYELWSIPSFSEGAPEIIKGSEIGSSKLKVKQNDILISKINPRINRVWLVEESDLEQLASPEWLVARIRDSNEIDSKFLQFYLSSPEFRDWISQAASSVTGSHSRAKANEILQRNIPLPPIDEQRKIVELLEDHLSRLDAALDDVRQAKILASQFRASVLNYVFFDSGTKGWTPYKAADLGKWITGSTPSSKVQDFIGEDVPFITPGDILDGGEIINYSRMISNSGADAVRRLRSNSVHLVCIGATLGKVGIVRFETTSNQQINALEANEEIVLPDFVMWLLATPSMQRKLWEASSSTTVPILNKGNLEKIEFRVPDLNGQRKALEEFDRVKLTYEHLNKDFESMLDKSNCLRRSILQAAFTGQLTKEVESV